MAQDHYDAVIIGAGMSGMAAAIRLAMFDKKVLLLEKHSISGGLNSYYKRAKRDFDVGLHALTNFAGAKERNKPLKKLLKQLRIPYDAFMLSEQERSKIVFDHDHLTFTNDVAFLESEIADKFPQDIDGFLQLKKYIEEYNEVDLTATYTPAKEVLQKYIKTELLREMILSPLLIYGSAWENDMDFSQFAIMFKAIYLEGFSRPQGGVRTIINLLLKKLEEVGAEVSFREGVEEINVDNGELKSITTTKGRELTTALVISSAGYPETLALLSEKPHNGPSPQVGKMSFVESIFITDKKPKDYDLADTIIFYNSGPRYHYQMPEHHTDTKSAVLCFPNNFRHDDYDEGVLRATLMANYKKWDALKQESRSLYMQEKSHATSASFNMIQNFLPGLTSEDIIFSDTFTPTTVKRYTGHLGGCVYGSPDKLRNGQTHIKGLVLCGTDQGFLGIIGSALSGISMANLYGLQS